MRGLDVKKWKRQQICTFESTLATARSGRNSGRTAALLEVSGTRSEDGAGGAPAALSSATTVEVLTSFPLSVKGCARRLYTHWLIVLAFFLPVPGSANPQETVALCQLGLFGWVQPCYGSRLSLDCIPSCNFARGKSTLSTQRPGDRGGECCRGVAGPIHYFWLQVRFSAWQPSRRLR